MVVSTTKNMTTIRHTFSFTHMPPVFKRGHQVMIAIFDREDRLYLARKDVYPIDIYRFFGGGVEPKEHKDAAAARELLEETGLKQPVTHQQTFIFKITDTTTNETFKYTVDLYYARLLTTAIELGDDVDGLKIFTPKDLTDLLTLYSELTNDLVSPGKQNLFRWSDWASVFKEMHAYILTHWPNT